MLTYVINLARAVDRRRRMTALLQEAGIDHEIIDAVDGKAMVEPITDYFDHYDPTAATKQEMSAVLSHIKAWERFLATDQAAVLVLEDDIHITEDFKAVVDNLRVDPDLLAIWRLETFGAIVTASRTPYQRMAACEVSEIFTNHAGAAAYVLNRKTAGYLVSRKRDFRRAIDTEMLDPERRTMRDLRIFQCLPAPSVQDMLLSPTPSQPFLASEVGRNRLDVISGRLRTGGSRLAELKERLRPAYILVATLGLSFVGKKRVRVKFGDRSLGLARPGFLDHPDTPPAHGESHQDAHAPTARTGTR